MTQTHCVRNQINCGRNHVWRRTFRVVPVRMKLSLLLFIAMGLCSIGCGRNTGVVAPLDAGADGDLDHSVPDGSNDESAADAADRVPLPPGCEGIAIESDGVLDLNLDAVQIQGSVTLDGAPLPNESALSRGSVVFRSADTVSVFVLSLGSSGPYSYRYTVPPGTYDVTFDANETMCAVRRASAMPCNDGPLISGVRIESDGVLDIDIPVVRVQGAVTLESAAMPSQSQERGALVFSMESGGTAVTAGFGTSGAASYSITLLPGQYDIGFDGTEAACASGTAPVLPCNDGPLRSDVALSTDGVLDLDIQAVRIQGAVTLEGSPFPAQPDEDRGGLVFALVDGGSASPRSFGRSGPTTYDLTLLSGTYDVLFNGNERACEARTAPAAPCNDGPLRRSVGLETDGVLDLDVRVVYVQGAVTLEGASMPNQPQPRGGLVFALHDGGSISPRNFGTSGPATYQLAVLEGTYDVSFDGNETACAAATAPSVPCNDGPLRSDITLATDGTLDLDLPAVRVTGAVTLEGTPMPSQPDDRGALVFAFANGGSVSPMGFGTTGAVSYALTLLPGTYEVLLNGNEQACADLTPPDVPCNDGLLHGDIGLTADGVLDLDVQAVRVTGAVTLERQPMPNEPQERGRLVFSLIGGGQIFSRQFDPAGPVIYAMTLVPGNYVVSHNANPGLCFLTSPSSVPCAGQVLLCE